MSMQSCQPSFSPMTPALFTRQYTYEYIIKSTLHFFLIFLEGNSRRNK
jgi:hypothetical protein